MSERIKRAIAALVALGALALGGAAIAGATGGGSDQSPAAQESADNEAAEGPEQAGEGPEQPGEAEESGDEQGGDDGDGELSAAVEQQAKAAAEQATGGKADGDIEPAEAADPVEDANDQPTPKGAAYEVEVTKDGQALKVFLDSSFRVLDTQVDAG